MQMFYAVICGGIITTYFFQKNGIIAILINRHILSVVLRINLFNYSFHPLFVEYFKDEI